MRTSDTRGSDRHPARARRVWRAALIAATVLATTGALAPQAFAQGSPQWEITAISDPTNFAPGDSTDTYILTAVNTGGSATDGSPVTIADVLPPAVTATNVVGGDVFSAGLLADSAGSANCDPSTVSCTYAGTFDVGDSLLMTVTVSVGNSASGTLTNTASVSGGGAASASTSEPTAVTATPATFGLAPGSFLTSTSTSQAGAHPNLTTSFALNTSSPSVPAADPRDVAVDLPPGLVGGATATPQCNMNNVQAGTCPADTMVGVATTAFEFPLGSGPGLVATADAPVYNITPYPGEPAAFGFWQQASVRLDTSVRSGGDYGITTTGSDLPDIEPILGATVTLWGVPADHNGPGPDNAILPTASTSFGGPGVGVASPFLDNPTQCSSGPLPENLTVDSYPQGTTPSASDSAQAALPQPTGCGALQFDPSLSVQPDVSQPDSPAGVDADLSLPQDQNPDALATPELRNATVTLPQGLVVSPSAAAGLQGCTDAEIALHSTTPATCPDASDIGTVQITTPLLPDPLTGQIFLGTPECTGPGGSCTDADAADGSMLRGYIQAQGDGVIVKLPGDFTTDPSTGQLTAHFDDNPQLPFSDLKLHFKSGPRGLVATPNSCGTFTTTSDLSPWSSPFTGDATPSSSFTVSGCGNPDTFAPTFTAGSENPQAGAYSPFTLTFSRTDQDQQFSGLTATMPPGVSAKLAGVPLCSDSDANAGTCPAASQVGTANIAAGPGPEPLSIPQPGAPQPSVYLTGPYKGAPYGLVVEAPAVAGPFNLGTVVVRQALFVDPTDAHVTVVSDPFPTMLAGIPLQIRTVSVDLNRPDFTINPTSCDPMAINATLTSTGGMSAHVSSRFQVGGCQDIGFSPKLKLALTGKGKTRSGDHPTLTATLTDPTGQANIQSAKVALPLSLALDPNNSNNVCPFATAQAVHGDAVGCSASTIVGTATAVTPLLSQPLTGNVYLVQGIRTNKQGQQIKTLPSLLVPLRGQIALDLRAQTSVSGGKLVTTFPTIPDAAVSSFTLKINGGKKGLLVVTGRGLNICQKNQVGNANFGAQSGKTTAGNMTLSTPCGKPAQLKVLAGRMSAGALTLRIRTSERGKVTVTGQQLAGFGKVLAAGAHQIKVQVKNSARRGSHSRHAVKMKVTVQVAPANAMPATRTFTVRG